MRFYKTFLRMVIAAGSITGFFGGWVLLAHAPKPIPFGSKPAAQAPALNPLPTLEPIPSLEDGPARLQPLPSLPQSSFNAQPQFRTGGS